MGENESFQECYFRAVPMINIILT